MDHTNLYNELLFYTLGHQDQEFFVHQLAVDAYTLQMADLETKPIALIYALIGVYLATEKGFTGREIQLEHVRLSNNKSEFPKISLPVDRGEVSIRKVMKGTPGSERDELIMLWCKSIWKVYVGNREAVVKYYKSSYV